MYDPIKSKIGAVALAAVTFLFGVGMASSLGWTEPSHAMITTSDLPQISEAAVQPALDLSDAFVNVAEHVTPAVVRIETERSVTVASRGSNPLENFFFDPRGQRDDSEPQERRSAAGGSGFLISPEGHILTNNHVVGDAEAIRVFLSDGRAFEAEVVGADPTTDVAVIKIEGDNLQTLSFGDSDALKVGEWILAVGNPGFGGGTSLEYTVTAGIVSAKGRGLQLISQDLQNDPQFRENNRFGFAIEDFIQTDAVINPGNSGGPMVNLRGQVVGINSAIASRTGYYQGYGFAIPIDLAERVAEDLIEYGQIKRAYLGIRMRSLDAVDAEAFGVPRVGGALVSEVTSDGPAEDAGLRSQDVITEVDGVEISTSSHLQQVIARKRPGDEVELRIYRDGRAMTRTLRLGEAPINDLPAVAERPSEPEIAGSERLGINVRNLTPEIAEQLGYDDSEGVVIQEVEPYSPAARRGLARGQRILRINNADVRDVDDVSAALADIESGQIVTFQIDAVGNPAVVNIRVP